MLLGARGDNKRYPDDQRGSGLRCLFFVIKNRRADVGLQGEEG